MLFLLPASLSGAAYEEEKPFIVAVNPCTGQYDKHMTGWRMPFTRKEIREWGIARGLELIDDHGPLIDDTAAYVGPNGSSVSISGFSRDRRYRVWIDFVRFRPMDRLPGSFLKIFVSAPDVEPRLIGSVRYSDIDGSYYHADIPENVTVRGSVEIQFKEFSPAPGNWGVWDIIVTDRRELPPRIEIDADTVNLEINDRIVQ